MLRDMLRDVRAKTFSRCRRLRPRWLLVKRRILGKPAREAQDRFELLPLLAHALLRAGVER
jgi:hypothetical protein